MAVCGNLVRLDSLNIQALFWLRSFADQNGYAALSDRTFERLRALEPEEPAVQSLGRIRSLQSELRTTSGAAEAVVYRQLGSHYERLHLPDEALDNYERAVRSDSTDAASWAALAIAYERYGALAPARGAYQRLAALDPENRDARRFLESPVE
jgi:Tfp pilus assembly protein PilF